MKYKTTVLVILIVLALFLFKESNLYSNLSKGVISDAITGEETSSTQSVIGTSVQATESVLKGNSYSARSVIEQRAYDDVKGLEVDFFWAVGNCNSPSTCEHTEYIGKSAATSSDAASEAETLHDGTSINSYSPGRDNLEWITADRNDGKFDDDYVHIYTATGTGSFFYNVEYPAYDHENPPSTEPTVVLTFPNKYCGRNDFGVVANHYYYRSGTYNFQDYVPAPATFQGIIYPRKYILDCSCADYQQGIKDLESDWQTDATAKDKLINMMNKWGTKC